MQSQRTDKFIEIYQSLDKTNLHLLHDIYHPQISFTDPLHQVDGINQLSNYFAELYSNVVAIHFSISDSHTIDDMAFIYWTMRYQHPKLNKGKQIAVSGHSRLKFQDDKIIAHRDYFDVGALLYRHVPLLGSVIKFIDNKAVK